MVHTVQNREIIGEQSGYWASGSGAGGNWEMMRATVLSGATWVPAVGICRSTVFSGWNEFVSCCVVACSRSPSKIVFASDSLIPVKSGIFTGSED